jgi:hypothetical protein
MKIVALFLLSIVSLSGCALTRVSSSAHNKEVNELALVGLSYKDAVEKTTKEGFKCYTHLEFQPYKSTRAGGKEGKRQIKHTAASRRSNGEDHFPVVVAFA